MYWGTPFSASSSVEAILDKENFTLEDLLDDDGILAEFKSQNSRLINFLRERAQMEQLLRYIVEEAQDDDAEETRTIKFPSIACEIFTCEDDSILDALVEDEELMKFLFSFLEPEHNHSTSLVGYFNKVVISILLRKTAIFMNYIQDHPEVIRKLVDLIGITSIMEVLIHLISVDEHLYTGYVHCLEDTDVLEMIVDKFSSSESLGVHANAAQVLCAVTRCAPPGLAAKISSPSFVGRLFHHALGDSRPDSVLVNSLSVCISLLDPKRYNQFTTYEPTLSPVSPNPETVEGMLGSLGDLLKLLDAPSHETLLVTTYGRLQPPLGKHRLKIVEFISVLVTVGNETAEGELIRLGALKQILGLFFAYPYNNFLHCHVENIVVSCLESKNIILTEHLLNECNLIEKILDAEKKLTLVDEPEKPTKPAEGRAPPRIGNIGHITRIANKIIQLGNNNSNIQEHLQKISEWDEWKTNILSTRNDTENVHNWECGRPRSREDSSREDSSRDDINDDCQDREDTMASLMKSLSQMFSDPDETHETNDQIEEDVYYDDESAEVVTSSHHLGDDHESGSSLFGRSNWFPFKDRTIPHDTDIPPPNPELDDWREPPEVMPMPHSSSLLSSVKEEEDDVVYGEDDENKKKE